MVIYPSKEYISVLSDTHATIGRALASGNMARLARAIVKVPDLLASVTDCICKMINKECETLCRPSSCSILRNTGDTSLGTFAVTSAAAELKESAPTVWKLLSACSCPQWRSKVVSDQLSARLVTAAACLLKARNQQMSALQYIVSIVLHNSGAKKKAFTRLNRLGMAMSHKRTLVKLHQMAAKFDTSLVDWKQSIESSNTCAQSSDRSQLHYTQSSESREEGTVNTRSLAAGCSTASDAAATTIDGVDDLLGCRTLFQVTGDNVDLEIKTKFMTLDRRNKSLHWFNIMATDERVVPPYILQTVGPRCSILSVPDSEFFPAVVDYQHLRSDFVILVSRVVVQNLAAFAPFSKFVVNHIDHEHSVEASQKSQRHCLGLLELNENKQQDMVEILSHINNRYVPYQYKEDDDHAFQPSEPIMHLQFGGDQLTAERARNSKKAVINGQKSHERLEALLPHAEDFHCMMNFVDLIYSKFYHTNSSSDVGTMYQLRNKVDRRNVLTDTKKNYRACNSFLQDVLDGYIVACAMKHFGISSPDDIDAIPPGLHDDLREAWFLSEMLNIVDTSVLQWKHLEKDAAMFQEAIGHGVHAYGETVVLTGDHQNQQTVPLPSCLQPPLEVNVTDQTESANFTATHFPSSTARG